MLQLICFLPGSLVNWFTIPIGKENVTASSVCSYPAGIAKHQDLSLPNNIPVWRTALRLTGTSAVAVSTTSAYSVVRAGTSSSCSQQIPTIHTPCQVKSPHFLIETLCRLFLSRRKAVPNLTATLPCQQGLPFLLRCPAVRSQLPDFHSSKCRNPVLYWMQWLQPAVPKSHHSPPADLPPFLPGCGTVPHRIRCDHHIAQMMPISIKDSLINNTAYFLHLQ